jgi:hypothetical protein
VLSCDVENAFNKCLLRDSKECPCLKKGRVFWPPCQSEAVRVESRLFCSLPVPVKGHRLQLGSVVDPDPVASGTFCLCRSGYEIK